MNTFFPNKDETVNNLKIHIETSYESNRLLPSNNVDSYLHDFEDICYEEGEKDRESSRTFEDQIYEVIEVENYDDTQLPPFSWKKLWLFTGPGILMSIAFLDPGIIIYLCTGYEFNFICYVDISFFTP